jgi:hypothetical protein
LAVAVPLLHFATFWASRRSRESGGRKPKGHACVARFKQGVAGASGKPAPALVLAAEAHARRPCKSAFVPGLWELAGSAFELSDLDPAGAAGRRPRWERAVISRPPLRPFRAWSLASGRALQVETRLSRSYLAPPSSIATLWWTSLASVRSQSSQMCHGGRDVRPPQGLSSVLIAGMAISSFSAPGTSRASVVLPGAARLRR